MAKLIVGMNQSLDGYVDHDAFNPDPVLFRHFIDRVASSSGAIYGRRIYEIMRYWETDDPSWDEDRRAFARAWRAQPRWVASRTLTAAGPYAALIEGDVEAAARRIKAEHEGEIEVAGTQLAHSLRGLIDEYWLYLHPVVLGAGKPLFAGPRPPLRLVASERIGEAVKLTYVPA